MHSGLRALVGGFALAVSLFAARTASACLTDFQCAGSPSTPICDTTTMKCVACGNNYSATTSRPFMCPTAAFPACNAPGTPLEGQCTQCTASDLSACDPSNTPGCTASGFCGCAQDSDCPAGKFCETFVPPAGFCNPGCTVHNGNSNCPAGTVCSVTDGGPGVCIAGDGGTSDAGGDSSASSSGGGSSSGGSSSSGSSSSSGASSSSGSSRSSGASSSSGSSSSSGASGRRRSGRSP